MLESVSICLDSGANIPVILAPATSILPSDGRPMYSHRGATAHDAAAEFSTVPGYYAEQWLF